MAHFGYGYGNQFGGYGVPEYANYCGGYGYNNSFALIVVLFILLIIVGTAYFC